MVGVPRLRLWCLVLFARGIIAAEMVEILVPLALLVWVVTAGGLRRAWPLMLVALVVTATLSALLWELLRTAANATQGSAALM